VQRLILARQSQVWATIRDSDDERRIVYSIAAAMHGRLCLSGKIWALDEERKAVVKAGVDFYKKAVTFLKDGVSRTLREDVKSYYEPSGWQLTIRKNEEGALLLFHGFDLKGQQDVSIPAKGLAHMKLTDTYLEKGCSAQWEQGVLTLHINGDFSGAAILLHK